MKPPRTLGISLAILLSVFLFTVLPLLQLAVLLIIQYRVQSIQIGRTLDVSGDPIAVGGSFGGLSNELLIIQVILGLIFLVIAVFAWRGRPESVRYLMIIGVSLLTVLYVWDLIASLLTPPTPSMGLDSGAEITRALLCAHLFANLLVPLYVIWYLNRAPARAFFHGAYLDDPREDVDGSVSQS